MQSVDFYQGHLDRVSRSFAFCIQKLDSPFRVWVSLSYLLCRVLDTVEDSLWESSDLQDAQYAEFSAFLQSAPSRETLKTWADRFPKSIPESEKRLLSESFELFADLHSLAPNARSVLQNAVRTMLEGMRFYTRRSTNGSLRLSDLADTNRYCYFVAGVVGELLSELFLVYRPDFKAAPDFKTNALHFGLFLQKVNLLKDQRSDEREGRYLVPNRRELMGSLRQNAIGAMDYLLALPTSEKGYRTFCAWSLFLGAASLPYMEKAYEADDSSKIPRTVTQELLIAIEDVVQDDVTLENAFQQYLPMLPEPDQATGHSPNASDGQWFYELTSRSLERSQMAELGML